jgi:subtilisin
VIDPEAEYGFVEQPWPHEDLVGHGTACSAIIRSIAPEAEIFSVRVLGANLKGKGALLHAGVEWSVEQGMDVANLSLSQYASVISVAARPGEDAMALDYNPHPPVEFGARGIDVPVAWADHGSITATGNSFAAPHVTGMVALMRSKHPWLTPFQVKAVLQAASANSGPGGR